jgi:hypothetical protein
VHLFEFFFNGSDREFAQLIQRLACCILRHSLASSQRTGGGRWTPRLSKSAPCNAQPTAGTVAPRANQSPALAKPSPPQPRRQAPC